MNGTEEYVTPITRIVYHPTEEPGHGQRIHSATIHLAWDQRPDPTEYLDEAIGIVVGILAKRGRVVSLNIAELTGMTETGERTDVRVRVTVVTEK